VEGPQRVGPALRDQAAIGVAHLRPEQGVIDPALRREDVKIVQSDPARFDTGTALGSSISSPRHENPFEASKRATLGYKVRSRPSARHFHWLAQPFTIARQQEAHHDERSKLAAPFITNTGCRSLD
jgi:hypothetical protein